MEFCIDTEKATHLVSFIFVLVHPH